MGNNDKQNQMRELIDQLNQWSTEYYEDDNPTVSDAKWDEYFDKLVALEEETGIVLDGSPTHKVSGKSSSGLKKVKHTTPMLSANKSTDINDIIKFLNGKDFVESYKEDGLTIVLRYNNGKLQQAITRGDGYEGEDVTENFRHCSNVPQEILYQNYLEVRGEAVISWADFNELNENAGGIYSHPRNLASGAVRQTSVETFVERRVKFLAFTLVNWRDIEVDPQIETYVDSLEWLKQQKFTTVNYVALKGVTNIENYLMDRENYTYPTDGWIFRYNDLDYGESLGGTSHHPNYMMALKPPVEAYKTKFRGIDYKVSRKGIVSLTAEFDPVNINGAIVTRASVHNVDIFNGFEFGIGDEIDCYLANEIIPQIHENYTRSNTYKLIDTCPCCGKPLRITTASETSTAHILVCDNLHCSARQLAKFDHFVSKACMNIDGLAESTLEVLLAEGVLRTFKDIYHLSEHKDFLVGLDRFGEKKVDNLLESIEKSRNVRLENYINALGISNIGKSASKTISLYFNGDVKAFYAAIKDKFDFTQLDDFGQAMNDSIYDFFNPSNPDRWIVEKLTPELNFIEEKVKTVENDFINGKTFVVTGKFENYTRSQIEQMITERGGKLSGSVSKKTDYLLTNDSESGSTKAEKAKAINIPIMSEAEFLKKVNC